MEIRTLTERSTPERALLEILARIGLRQIAKMQSEVAFDAPKEILEIL